MTTAITMGRFRIFTAGHYNLIARMVRENDNVIVGVSRHSECQRSVDVIRHFFPNITVVYTSTLFSLIQEYPDTTHVYLGADQAQLGCSLIRYHNVDLTLVNRPEGAPSSSRCRELFNQQAPASSYVEEGLAMNHIHSLMIIGQAHLETL